MGHEVCQNSLGYSVDKAVGKETSFSLPSIVLLEGLYSVKLTAIFSIYLSLGWQLLELTGNESVPKIITNNTINLFFKLQSAFC